jgi:hypothetical protein
VKRVHERCLLGLSKEERDAHYDDIVAFADIENFIDRPVKTYSSGMMDRLAFAVQAQICPGIFGHIEAMQDLDFKRSALRWGQRISQARFRLFRGFFGKRVANRGAYARLLARQAQESCFGAHPSVKPGADRR